MPILVLRARAPLGRAGRIRITSTGGRSGGALQELTSFVYGAALIYLLGGGMDNKLKPSLHDALP